MRVYGEMRLRVLKFTRALIENLGGIIVRIWSYVRARFQGDTI